MIFSKQDKSLAYLSMAKHIETVQQEDSETYDVIARFNCAVGNEKDGFGAVEPYNVSLFSGTEPKCNEFLDWLNRELDAFDIEDFHAWREAYANDPTRDG